MKRSAKEQGYKEARCRAGFTLLEVLLSMVIFFLLAGGIFAAVAVSTKASSEIALLRLDSERMDAMQGFLRRIFSSLPATARLELRVRQGDASGNVQELLIAPVSEIAAFSQDAQRAGGLVLGATREEKGAYSFSLTNFNTELSAEKRDRQLSEGAWIKMLSGVRKIRWRFAGKDTVGLQETWNANSGRPRLVNLEISLQDGSETHWEFLVPDLQPIIEEEKTLK